MYKDTAKAVKRAARNDKRRYLESIATDAENAAGANNMRKLFEIVGKLTNCKLKSNRGIKDENRELITDTEKQTHIWKRHFEQISSTDDNADEIQHIRNENTHNINEEPPSMEEIVNAVTALKRNKSPGEDGLPAELLQVDPTASASIIHPFLLEMWHRERLSIEWTRGAIIKLPKKGDLTDSNNWRGITLLNTICTILEELAV
ncbi:uncharacterized protein [Musca autumnalis]|uniref:uncharacterized protein n=1 Tax=Musca autumnalis TaxID=221902 RepID=UPI003CEF6526